tara:strand:- start:164 stop:586 length:423 start_codon:yes stop_codon:yes gene_type:complete
MGSRHHNGDANDSAPNQRFPPKKMPAKAHKPTYQTRKTVRGMTLAGISQPLIAEVLDISKPTLTKHYARILKLAMAQANGEIAECIMATGKQDKNPALLIFWAKARMGWSEKQHEIDELKARIQDLEERLVSLATARITS